MVGREHERSVLAVALDDARHGQGRAVLLLGEAGMGKSMLADWLVHRAADAHLGIARRACSAAGMPALWPWRMALADIAPDLPWREENAASVQADRELLAAAVVDAIASAARRQPLLIVLEDVQWSDQTTLLVARAVADAVVALPIMLLLTCRDDPGEARLDVRTRLAELPTGVRRVLLAPLDSHEVAVLAARLSKRELAEDDVRALHARTGGNPFFVGEVVRLQLMRGPAAGMVVPPGVREVLERRLARLGQRCAAVVTLAAVAAQTSADLIEDDLLIDAEPDGIASLLDEAVAARLVETVPAGAARYRFRHALVREVLDAGLSGAERARLHTVIAQRLERRIPAPAPSRLAYHWSRAAGVQARERSAFWSLRAARDAMAELGFDVAARHFRQALADPSTDRVAVSIELGEALQLSGDVLTARQVLLDAAREAADAGRAVDLAHAALALGGGLAGFEVPIMDERQVDVLKQADAALPPEETAMRAAVRGRLSLALTGAAQLAERIALARDAVDIARRSGDGRVESAVLAAYCDAIAGPDHVAERIAAADRMLTLAGNEATAHDRTSALLARRLLLVAHLENGDLAAADEQAGAYERIATQLGIPLYGWFPEIWRGMRALLDGDPDSALQHAASAEQIGRAAQSVNAELMAFTVRLQAHLDRNTPREFAADARALLEQIAPAALPAMYVAGPARLLLAAGDSRPARSVLRTFRSGNPDAMPKDAEWLEAHWAMADIAIVLDDHAAVAALFDALSPYPDLWAVDGIGGVVFGTIAEQLGRLATHLGRSEDAAQYLAIARESYVRQGTPALLARVDAVLPTRAISEPGVGRLHRDGMVWSIEWQGRRSVVPDAKGLHDLAVLLPRPGQAVPALELVAAAGGPPAAATGNDLGPVLDATARTAYRRRLAELDRELDEADADADLGRAERLRAERAMLVRELSAAFGLGGRARVAGDPAERARKAVTMRIRAAIRSIEAHDEGLARHLRNAVRTGRLCSYEPETPVSWRT
ncbi:MAG TPA: AAA family ATPase [Jatrophihabitantaceae bacterium]